MRPLLLVCLLGAVVASPALAQGSCSNPDPFEPNQTCGSPASIQDGTWAGLNVAMGDPDYYTFGVDPGAVVDLSVLHSVADADVDAFLFVSNGCNPTPNDPGCDFTLACGYTGSDDEVLSWTNSTGAQVNCTLRVSVYPGSAGSCAPYTLLLAGVSGPGGPGGGSVTPFCSPAQANSTGFPASLAAAFYGGQLLGLAPSGGPDNQFGYFVVSASTTTGVQISDGLMCLGAPIGRYNAASGPAFNSLGQFQGGVFVNLSGTALFGLGFEVPTTLPGTIGGTIDPGESWHFQLWYRDVGGASNFTNGITATY
jgi:hypothetical protein